MYVGLLACVGPVINSVLIGQYMYNLKLSYNAIVCYFRSGHACLVSIFRSHQMSKVVKLNDDWLEKSDSNQDIVKTWCTKDDGDSVSCSWCSKSGISIKVGLNNILSHAKSEKHKKFLATDEKAYHLTELGPQAKQLTRRLLLP